MKKGLKKYFIPHDENNHQPHSLRDKSLRNILITSILFEIIALIAILPVFNSKLDYLSAVLPSILVSETNKEREVLNLNELENNDLLVLAAQMKANDMAEKGYFAHVTPDGKQPWYFLTQAGYEYEVAGENLAVNFVDSRQVHRAWMNSPTHKANIVKDSYTEIGIATAKGIYKGREAIFVAQFFGKPKVQPIVAQVDTVQSEQIELVQEEVVSEKVEEVDKADEAETVAGTSTITVTSVGSFKDVPEMKVRPLSSDKILSSPLTIIGFILSALLLLISVSLLLKIFVKIKVQYPKMILNSSLVIVALASFYLLNSVLVDLFGEIL